MTISKKLKSRSESRGTLEYVYRGEKSHPVIGKKGKLLLDNARHIGGQLSSADPFQYGLDCKPNQVNIDELASELDQQVTKYRGLGSGKKLIQHYVISLAPGESLSDKDWRKVVKTFMDEMGYGNDTLYTACVHTEKDHEHAHVVACRVRHNGKLVSDKNDYAKAVAASREIEKQFGLKITPNPDQTMGVEPTRKDVELDRKGIKLLSEDPAVIIRKRINTVFDTKKAIPQMTMSDFVHRLKEQDIQIKIKLNKEDEPVGINYSIDGKLWISGSKIKKTRTTWTALLAKEKIDYNPSRDNGALGIGGKEVVTQVTNQIVPKKVEPDSVVVSFFVQLSSKQKAELQKRNIIELYQNEKDKKYYALLNFKIRRPLGCETDELKSLLQTFVELLLMILNILFCGVVFSGKLDNNCFFEVNNLSRKYEFDLELNDKHVTIIQALHNELSFISEAKSIELLNANQSKEKLSKYTPIKVKLDINYTISIDIV